MIYKLTFDDATVDWCTAKDQLHLLKSYDDDYYLSLQDIESIDEISEEEAKKIMIKNTEYDENDPEDKETICLFDLAVDDDFCIIASTEFY
jgi:hypothetical protein